MEQILKQISDCIERLDTLQLGFTHERSEMLDKLSINYFRLTEHRDKAHKDWMSYYFNSKANSSAAKEREADMKVPELYTLRHLQAATKLVIDSLRTSISANKNG